MSFMDQALQLVSADTPNTDIKVNLGEAQQQSKGTSWKSEDRVNSEAPDVEGLIISAAYTPGGKGVNVTALVTRVVADPSSFSTIQLPSGMVVMPVCQKLTKETAGITENVALPHQLDSNGWITTISGVATFELVRKKEGKGARVGVNGAVELEVDAINKPGTRIVFKRVTNKHYSGKNGVNLTINADSFNIIGEVQNDEDVGKKSLFDAFASEQAKAYHIETLCAVNDHVGHRDDGLKKIVDQDALALAVALEERIASEAKIGGGTKFERPLVPDAAREAYQKVVLQLRGGASAHPSVAVPLSLMSRTNVLHPHGVRKPVALVQFPMAVADYCRNRDHPTTMLTAATVSEFMKAFPPPKGLGNGPKQFGSVQLMPSAEKRRMPIATEENPSPKGLSEHQICSESQMVTSWDVSLWSSYYTVDGVTQPPWTPTMQTSATNAVTIPIAKLDSSLAKSHVCDMLGAYNYYMIHLLQELAAQHMPMIVFVTTMGCERPAENNTLMARPLVSSYTDRRDVYDYKAMVRSVGVPVSSEWVRAKMVDAEDCFRHPLTPKQQALNIPGAGLTPPRDPRPPKFTTNNYQLLNGLKETPAKRILDSDAEFYALYDGCVEHRCILDNGNESFNTEEHLNAMTPADLYNKVAIYAIKPLDRLGDSDGPAVKKQKA